MEVGSDKIYSRLESATKFPFKNIKSGLSKIPCHGPSHEKSTMSVIKY